MKPRTLLFPLLLLCAGLARADKPDGDVILREKLEKIDCAEFTAKVSDGPALAAALQQTLRASPGGEAINVLWRPAEPALPKSPLELDIKDLDAHTLLSAVCRNSGIFWGLRNGAVILNRVPVPGTVLFSVDPVMMRPVGILESTPDESNSNEADAKKGSDGTSDTLRWSMPGVEWRDGETLIARYEPTISKLVVTTSEEYFPLVRAAIRTLGLIPHQVSITSTWIAYPSAAVEKALAATARTALRQEDLMKLYAGPEKKILHTQTVLALSGINGVAEAVDEIIYPTEFDVSEVDVTIMADQEPQKTEPYRYLMGIHVPGGFETRQIGGILNVTPTINPDNETLNLVLLPEVAELVGWIQYGYEPKQPPDRIEVPGVHMPQPTFRSHNLTTTVVVKDGSTLVLSGGRDPESGEYLYCYITAELLDTEGKALR